VSPWKRVQDQCSCRNIFYCVLLIRSGAIPLGWSRELHDTCMWRELLLFDTGHFIPFFCHFNPIIACNLLATVFFLPCPKGLTLSSAHGTHPHAGWECSIRSLSFFRSCSEWVSWAAAWPCKSGMLSLTHWI